MSASDFFLRPTRDHVVAKSRLRRQMQKRGNIVWACYACNQMKGDMALAAWYAAMNQFPEWWRYAEKRGPRGVGLHVAMIECGFSMPPLEEVAA
jgi:hypothetical protein